MTPHRWHNMHLDINDATTWTASCNKACIRHKIQNAQSTYQKKRLFCFLKQKLPLPHRPYLFRLLSLSIAPPSPPFTVIHKTPPPRLHPHISSQTTQPPIYSTTYPSILIPRSASQKYHYITSPPLFTPPNRPASVPSFPHLTLTWQRTYNMQDNRRK